MKTKQLALNLIHLFTFSTLHRAYDHGTYHLLTAIYFIRYIYVNVIDLIEFGTVK